MRLPIVHIPAAPPEGFDTGPASIQAVRVLRISVTDRCNYRCVYCMPEEGVAWLPKNEILSFEEIAQVVQAAVEVHGISRFKLTGGEPTVRSGLVDLVKMLREIPGIEDLSLTTNGQRLSELAQPLRDAGLDRVTVSIDSLQPAKFRRITRTGDLRVVLEGLDRAQTVGLSSIKINCVTMRGTNDDELVDFARLTLDRDLTVRFIVYMPLGHATFMDGHEDDGSAWVWPTAGCEHQLRGANALIPSRGPARCGRSVTGQPGGCLCFVSAMSTPLCFTGNRLRLTANGLLRSCLFDGGEVDLKPILRGHLPTAAAIADAMTECVRLKPTVHSSHGNQQMSRIGG